MGTSHRIGEIIDRYTLIDRINRCGLWGDITRYNICRF